MHKYQPIPRKSITKLNQKQNISETLNNDLPKDKTNLSIPNLLIHRNFVSHLSEYQDNHKRITRKHTLDSYKNQFIKSSQNLSTLSSKLSTPSIITNPICNQYDINELENINLLKEYSDDFIKNGIHKLPQPTEFLDKHEINSSLRAKMIDWMIEVFSSYKCLDSTFFKAVEILDRYFRLTPFNQQTKQLHLIGVSAIFVAAKTQEIYPLKLNTIYDKIAHKKLSIQSIKQKQTQFFSLFGFNIVSNTLYDIVKIVVATIQKDLILTSKQIDQLQKLFIYIAKMVIYEYGILCKHRLDVIAAGVILIGLKIYEQLCSSLLVDDNMRKVYEILNLSKDKVNECSNKILKLVKTFDKSYPTLGNFKKFNKMNFDQKDKYISL